MAAFFDLTADADFLVFLSRSFSLFSFFYGTAAKR
jgi:hypothetical protein